MELCLCDGVFDIFGPGVANCSFFYTQDSFEYFTAMLIVDFSDSFPWDIIWMVL